jgi:hypothetical protein
MCSTEKRIASTPANTFRSRGKRSHDSRGRVALDIGFEISGLPASNAMSPRYEGAAVEVEGYITDYKLEFPEPPNCYSTNAAGRDYHIWLTENPHQGKRESIVIEITPRVRISHSGWTDERLAALVETQARVRIRGWLMLDQMHPESMPWTRFTLWEVHPIMQIDWRTSRNAWVSLDILSPASDSSRERPPR